MARLSLMLVLVLTLNVHFTLSNLRDKVASLSEDGIDLLEQERQLIQKLKEQLEKSSTIPPDASELDVLASSTSLGTTCHLLPTEIHVTKEELDESGNTVRTCEGDLQVHKCEGSCSSELRPSITSPTGFAKKCNCCRESEMKLRSVELINCYNSDGVKFTDIDKATMIIKLKEPSVCNCRNCGT